MKICETLVDQPDRFGFEVSESDRHMVMQEVVGDFWGVLDAFKAFRDHMTEHMGWDAFDKPEYPAPTGFDWLMCGKIADRGYAITGRLSAFTAMLLVVEAEKEVLCTVFNGIDTTMAAWLECFLTD